MKTLKVKTSPIQRIADSIGNYIFNDLKGGFANNDINWLSQFCGLYNKLTELSLSNTTDAYCQIEVGDTVERGLPGMIARYIFNDIKDVFDFTDDDVEWICEMMSIYNQLLDTSKKGTASVINTENTSSADKKNDAKKEDGLDPAQIIKNIADKVEEAKAVKPVPPQNTEIQTETPKPDNKKVTEAYQTSGSKPDVDKKQNTVGFKNNEQSEDTEQSVTSSSDIDLDWDATDEEIY